MCGIAGVVSTKEAINEAALAEMSRRLAHRGPDQAGSYQNTQNGLQVALATRRLAILDLSPAGHQPMASGDESLLLAYNGEVYNHLELRDELEKKGYKYRSRSDTETILYAYQEWGVSALARFNGMFALALYDRNRGEMVLARDRMGIKPLYYAWDSHTLVFASELKALLAYANLPKEINPTALWLFLTLGYVPSPYCIYKGVSKLEPGHYLRFHQSAIQVKAFRTLSSEHTQSVLDREDAAQSIRAALEDAVKRQLMSDVPIGMFLSGGVDSSIITALARQFHADPFHTFTTGYSAGPDGLRTAYNEDLAFARRLAGNLETVHHEICLDSEPELIPTVKDLVAQMDEPLVEPAFVYVQLMSQAARAAGVPVMLTGDGADELFGGYDRYFAAQRLAFYEKLPTLPYFLHLIDKLKVPAAVKENALGLRRLLGQDRANQYITCSSIFWPEQALSLIHPDLSREVDPLTLAGLVNEIIPPDDEFPDAMAKTDLHFWVGEHFNPRLDRISMMYSVEARVPYQDDAVVEVALAIPLRIKSQRNNRKGILKLAFQDLLPREIWERPKIPFQAPAALWLKNMMRERIKPDVLPEFLNQVLVREWRLKEGKGAPGGYLALWALVTAELWAQSYLHSE